MMLVRAATMHQGARAEALAQILESLGRTAWNARKRMRVAALRWRAEVLANGPSEVSQALLDSAAGWRSLSESEFFGSAVKTESVAGGLSSLEERIMPEQTPVRGRVVLNAPPAGVPVNADRAPLAAGKISDPLRGPGQGSAGAGPRKLAPALVRGAAV